MKQRAALIVLVLVAVIFLVFTDFGKSRTRVYDCGMAEWHPDIPNEVKIECRRLRYENWKHQQELEKNNNHLRT